MNHSLQPAKRRSKTCILIKNLPANTEKEELKSLFAKHGPLARFLMPEHGITALVDFVEPFEAKKAFTRLAYSQFKSTPLYLEWAPENVFVKSAIKSDAVETSVLEKETEAKPSKELREDSTAQHKTEDAQDEKEDAESEPEEDPEPDTTLFVKNINFKTTDDMLRKVSN